MELKAVKNETKKEYLTRKEQYQKIKNKAGKIGIGTALMFLLSVIILYYFFAYSPNIFVGLYSSSSTLYILSFIFSSIIKSINPISFNISISN